MHFFIIFLYPLQNKICKLNSLGHIKHENIKVLRVVINWTTRSMMNIKIIGWYILLLGLLILILFDLSLLIL